MTANLLQYKNASFNYNNRILKCMLLNLEIGIELILNMKNSNGAEKQFILKWFIQRRYEFGTFYFEHIFNWTALYNLSYLEQTNIK